MSEARCAASFLDCRRGKGSVVAGMHSKERKSMSKQKAYALGIDLGGTKTLAAVIDVTSGRSSLRLANGLALSAARTLYQSVLSIWLRSPSLMPISLTGPLLSPLVWGQRAKLTVKQALSWMRPI